MQEYESYIVTMLQDDNIRIFDPTLIAEGDEEQVLWNNGEISLAEYLKNAIAKGYIEVTSIMDENEEYSDTQEVYNSLTAFIMDELARDNKFAKSLYKYLIMDDQVTGYQICMVLFEQELLSDDDGMQEMLISGGITPYELITEKILQNSNGKPLPKRNQVLYNEHSVPQDQGSSGLCGENE